MFAGGGIGHVVDGHFGVVFGSIGHFSEFDAVETLCHSEYAFAHRVDGEVGADLVFVEVEFLAAYFLGVVIVVPGFDCYACVFAVGELLHFRNLGLYAGHGRTPDLHEQVFGGSDGLGHDIAGHVGAVVLESQKRGFFSTHLQDAADYRQVVVFAAACQGGIALVYLFAEVAVVGILQQRQSAGCVEGEYPVSFAEATAGGFFGGDGYAAVGQSGKGRFVVDHNGECVGGVKQVAVECEV